MELLEILKQVPAPVLLIAVLSFWQRQCGDCISVSETERVRRHPGGCVSVDLES